MANLQQFVGSHLSTCIAIFQFLVTSMETMLDTWPECGNKYSNFFAQLGNLCSNLSVSWHQCGNLYSKLGSHLSLSWHRHGNLFSNLISWYQCGKFLTPVWQHWQPFVNLCSNLSVSWIQHGNKYSVTSVTTCMQFVSFFAPGWQLAQQFVSFLAAEWKQVQQILVTRNCYVATCSVTNCGVAICIAVYQFLVPSMEISIAISQLFGNLCGNLSVFWHLCSKFVKTSVAISLDVFGNLYSNLLCSWTQC